MRNLSLTHLSIAQLHISNGCFGIWINGVGVAGKDTRKHRLLFSERNGLRKHLMILGWSLAWVR